MVETRKQVAQRIIRDTLGQGPNSALEVALTEADLLYIGDWLLLGDDDLDELAYLKGNVLIPLRKGTKQIMRVFRCFVNFKRLHGAPSDYIGVDAIAEEFESF